MNVQSPCAFVPRKIVLSSDQLPENVREDYTPAGTYNGAAQWTSSGTPGQGELFTIRWTGSQWEIVYNKYGTFATNNSGSITNLPCTGWGGFGALTLSGGCGALVNPDAPNVSITPSSQTIPGGQSATLTASGADTYLWDTTPASSKSIISVSPTRTIAYSVTGTTNGCTGTATVTVSCVPPTVYTVTGGGSYCTGGRGVAIGGWAATPSTA
ncbi:hypothetical protein [Arsenicibacter rosenii]|nr:hypothetical protein [Arsenicibacter rosenii]